MVVDRLDESQAGLAAGIASMSRVECDVLNSSGRNYDLGEAMQISGYDGPDGTDPYDIPGSIEYTCIEPVWHSDIDNIVIAAEPIPDGERGRVVLSGHCVIKAFGPETGRYAMIDPATPYQMLVSQSGIARVCHRISTSYLLCMLGLGSSLWRYKLTEASLASATTTAKLVRLDVTEYSATTVELSDPLSIGNGDATDYEGYCQHVGNEFHIAPGPC